MLLGDVEAQVSACLAGRDLVAELLEKHGFTAFRAAVHAMWDRADEQVRKAIALAVPGEYRAYSFLDNDGLVLDETVPVGVKVRIEDEHITVDFSEVSEQRTGPMNAGRNGGAVAAARIAMKYLLSPEEPVNEGDFRALSVEIPDGKFLSARSSAPIAGSGTMIPTVVDTILHALADAFPDRVAAAHHGTYGIHSFHGVSPVTGATFHHAETFVGGWGASATMDGYGPSRSNIHGDTRDVPIEMQESFHPYRLESYRLRSDSGGAGEFRGGLGVEKFYRIVGPCWINLQVDRTKCPAWGLRGGRAGMTGDVEITRAGGEVLHVLKGNYPLHAGDTVRVRSGGGGGYGNPWCRRVESVEEDVRLGYVSVAAAEETYGAVFGKDGCVDVDATARRRRELANGAT
jgi:N-methylhydantoinase B